MSAVESDDLRAEALHVASKGSAPYFPVELGREATLKENGRRASNHLKH